MERSNNNILGIGLRMQPTHVTQYPIFERSSCGRSQKQLFSQANLRNNQHDGNVSYKAAKRLRNSINWLVASSQKKRIYSKKDKRTYMFQLNFITLTLPSLDHEITDHQFKNKLLKVWLQRIKYRHGLKNYVWKVETQKNGNIHAHITTDCFIHYADIRDSWNSILVKNGLMRSFADKHGHSDPNSTDVKSVKNIRNLSAYLSKYFSKSETDRRNVKGRLWASSYSLSDKNVCNIIVNPTDDDNILDPLISCNAEIIKVESDKNAFGHRRHLATVFLMKPSIWKSIKSTPLGSHYIKRLREIREGNSVSRTIKYNYHETKFTKFNSSGKSADVIGGNRQIPIFDNITSSPTASIKKEKRLPIQFDLFQPVSRFGDKYNPSP
jgi:hypothetical protein